MVEIESTLDRPVAVVLGGGAVAASSWWRRAFRAALAPRQVIDVAEPEVGAIGAAMIATGQAGANTRPNGQVAIGRSHRRYGSWRRAAGGNAGGVGLPRCGGSTRGAGHAPQPRSRLRVRDWRVRTKLAAVLLIPSVALLALAGVQIGTLVDAGRRAAPTSPAQVRLGQQIAAARARAAERAGPHRRRDLAAFEVRPGAPATAGELSAALIAPAGGRRHRRDRSSARPARRSPAGRAWQAAYDRAVERLDSLRVGPRGRPRRQPAPAGRARRVRAHDRRPAHAARRARRPAPSSPSSTGSAPATWSWPGTKELGSQLRARIFAVGAAGGFGPGDYVDIADLRAQRLAALVRFRGAATAAQVDGYDDGAEPARVQRPVDADGAGRRSTAPGRAGFTARRRSVVAGGQRTSSTWSAGSRPSCWPTRPRQVTAAQRRPVAATPGWWPVLIAAGAAGRAADLAADRPVDGAVAAGAAPRGAAGGPGRAARGAGAAARRTRPGAGHRGARRPRCGRSTRSARWPTRSSPCTAAPCRWRRRAGGHAAQRQRHVRQPGPPQPGAGGAPARAARRPGARRERPGPARQPVQAGPPGRAHAPQRREPAGARRQRERPAVERAGRACPRRCWPRSPRSSSTPGCGTSADDTWHIVGHAVADLVHLLAELLENATAFSPPDTAGADRRGGGRRAGR